MRRRPPCRRIRFRPHPGKDSRAAAAREHRAVRNLPAEAWTRRGVANRYTVTPRAIAAGLVGHERHHLKVLRERYGV